MCDDVFDTIPASNGRLSPSGFSPVVCSCPCYPEEGDEEAAGLSDKETEAEDGGYQYPLYKKPKKKFESNADRQCFVASYTAKKKTEVDFIFRDNPP